MAHKSILEIIKENPSGRFIALDFETATHDKTTVCQIGAVIIKNWRIEKSSKTFINPLVDEFNPICESITGIHLEDVQDAPLWTDIWPKMDKVIGNSPIICHNYGTERTAIVKSGAKYNTPSDYQYIDTLQLSRKLYPELPDHKLPTVLENVGLSIENHHDALDDAVGCANLFLKMVENQVKKYAAGRNYRK